MPRSRLLAALVLGQAGGLLIAGVATLRSSQALMGLLIHVVGEERALGRANVIHRGDGSVLLTNPAAMVRWMLPFWALGCLQIASACTLVVLWFDRRASRRDRIPPE